MKKVVATLFFTLALGIAAGFAGGAKDEDAMTAPKEDAMMAPKEDAMMAPKEDAMMAPKDAMKSDDKMAPKEDAMMAPEDAMKGDDKMAPKDVMKGDDKMAPKDAMKSDAMAPKDAMMVDPSMAVFDLTGLGPSVIPYSGEAAAQRLAAEKRVVYYFAAEWCPTCKATYADLKVNAMKAPKDLAIVVVDYDKEGDLKTKYGVTYQHTYVAIGPMGEKRKVWSGSMKLSDIVMETPKK